MAGFIRSAFILAATALVTSSAMAAPLVSDTLGTFTGFPAGTVPDSTIPSGNPGVNWQYFGTVNAVAGFPSTLGPDGDNAISVLPAETNGLVANDVAYTMSATQRTYQAAFKVRIDATGAVASHSCFLGGFYLGDAPATSFCMAVGTSTGNLPAVKVGWTNSGTANTGFTSSVTGIPVGTWVGMVVQYEAPSTISGTDGGFFVWFDPVLPTDAPLLAFGTGVTGGNPAGLTGLGLTAARPTNGIFTPQFIGFGQTLFGNTAGTAAAGSIDQIALWDGPADITTADQALLAEAIAWLAAPASVDEWSSY